MKHGGVPAQNAKLDLSHPCLKHIPSEAVSASACCSLHLRAVDIRRLPSCHAIQTPSFASRARGRLPRPRDLTRGAIHLPV